jgi:hypothetical protein
VNIELVVTHRNLVDQDGPNIPSPKRTELYASGNVKELSKLSALAPSKSRVNFLLLIDTQGDKAYDPVKLKQKYRRTRERAWAICGQGRLRQSYRGYQLSHQWK